MPELEAPELVVPELSAPEVVVVPPPCPRLAAGAQPVQAASATTGHLSPRSAILFEASNAPPPRSRVSSCRQHLSTRISPDAKQVLRNSPARSAAREFQAGSQATPRIAGKSTGLVTERGFRGEQFQTRFHRGLGAMSRGRRGSRPELATLPSDLPLLSRRAPETLLLRSSNARSALPAPRTTGAGLHERGSDRHGERADRAHVPIASYAAGGAAPRAPRRALASLR
jgi:hypothetical protein